MNFLAIIPARFASTRFPGKPLALVKGEPMIKRVYEQVSKAFDLVCVATDDERIYNLVNSFGGIAVMTGEHHSGTDRCYEAMEKFSNTYNTDFDIVVNIQGDEPYILPEQIEQLKSCFNDKDVKLATLVKKIKTKEELFNHNAPKVVIDNNGYALYFSRLPIPFARDIDVCEDFIIKNRFYRHIGIYGYTKEVLTNICKLQSGYLENMEKLEQLRWLENGLKIKVNETEYESYAVDTPQDLDAINSLF